MSWDFLKPKRKSWAIRSSLIAANALALYIVLSWRTPWAAGRFWGLTFGTLAALIFLVDAMYPLRRRLMSWPLGSAQRWLQFHIYGGLLACLFVLIHIGFRWPGGQFGWWLFVLTIWSTVSGMIGVWLQKYVPVLLANQLSVEALAARIPEMVGRLQAEADQIVKGASEMLERVYLNDVRPSLATVTASWGFLADIRGGRDRRLAPLRNVSQFLAEDERPRLDDLQAIVTEKLELDAQYNLQRVLRVWLVLHVPPAFLLTGLVVVHVATVWFF
jgi:hypothetical protein